MEDTAYRAIAIVGVGSVLPDAVNVAAFWKNIESGRYSITEVAPDRWDPALYYDSDRNAPDKTYSKIGGWVREYPWDPMKWRLAIPPRVADAMDGAQKWGIACTRSALEDYGYPQRPLDTDRTAVILGNAMAGEKHYLTVLRIQFPEYARELSEAASFAALPEALRREIKRELHQRMSRLLPEITEDTMPGELSNCIAGRIANIYNFHGPNYVVDAACASAMAAISSAVDALVAHDFDAAITGGIDRNMGVSSFVKFCKIGALSATGTRPYAEGADGFVMGEGAVIFLLKRLADAERDGDKVYAVLRGMAGASDGKGKGITAPNPVGQRICIQRAWENAGLSPATATLMEGHGTSTSVGDVVEVQSMTDVLAGFHVPPHSVALGSVKSNIGHLKAASGAAGLLKTALALQHKVLPPSVNCEHPNSNIDFAHSPLYVNSELRPWTATVDGVRRAGVSAFGFGGTNFHVVLEEYIPHRLNGNGKRSIAVSQPPVSAGQEHPAAALHKAPLRGALVIGAPSEAALSDRLLAVQKEAQAGRAPAPSAPAESDLRAIERLAIDYADAADLADKSSKALKALAANQAAVWKALRAQGIFRGHGPAPKVAFLYPGQGSQYVNMLQRLRAVEPIVAETFAEADRVMTPLLGKPLSQFIFVDQADPKAVEKAEEDLRQTAITQPAVLAADLAITRLLAAYGIQPDMTMGHSLGEYGALVAAGALPFADALEAVSARGREMTRVSMADNGRMAAVFAPIAEVERILKTIDGYVVIANINSGGQSVIGGASQAVAEAIEMFQVAGYNAVPLPVSHAFHTAIVAPASEPLRRVLERLHLEAPHVPTVANVSGEFYPAGAGVTPQMLDILARQVASPVQFVKGLGTLYGAGARIFVEVGPKKALQGFAEDVLGNRGEVVSLFTNHPKTGDIVAFNQALCSLYAAGLGASLGDQSRHSAQSVSMPAAAAVPLMPPAPAPAPLAGDRYTALGHMFADVLERGWEMYHGQNRPAKRDPVAITGASLGLPGTERIFDDGNIGRILRGQQFIDVIPSRFRHAMLDKHITRLVKSANGEPTFEHIQDVGDVVKLAGRGGAFDLESEYGVSAERRVALDRVTCLAMAAGIDALRDAGIPLVLRYKTTSLGTQLPDRWGLPDAMRDDTGVIFACVFPGFDSFAQEMARYSEDRARREQLAALESLRSRMESNGHSTLGQEMDRRIGELRAVLEKEPYVFDRRFLFRVLSMGHSQFAEFIGARGPNTQINSACASTTQGVALAEDWIRAGRCRRVIVISADDVTSDNLIEWFGAGFLASGAAATDEVVEDAAVPFDRRRHGMLMGMGAAALVVESADAVRERGIRPICEVLAAVTANSAFHGTRLDVEHIGRTMETLVAQAEANGGISRSEVAPRMVFVSHETYTPARGGSASAEIHALRKVFGDAADRVVIANTKGFTGHAMGTGIEDVVAIKALETGWVPPVANFREVDPELGPLNLSKGGIYPIEYALRLGAGFGSQISMTLLRWVKSKDGVRPSPNALGYAYRIADAAVWDAWLSRMAGNRAADLEVVQRTLRVREQGSPARVAEPAQETRPTPAPLPAPPKPVQPEPPKAAAFAPKPAESDPVKDRILRLVAEVTGYPVDMLDLDLDLEADLGVDTVKQAEVFATIREAYGIARDDKVKLREFPTLAHVIRFVHERRPDLMGQAASRPASHSPGDPVKERIMALVVEKTGYPQDMLDLDLDLEADLGVDTVKQAELFAAIRQIYDIPRADNLKLRDFPTLAHIIHFVHDRRPDLAAAPEPFPDQSHDRQGVVSPKSTISGDPVKERILALVVEKTGYPQDMLDLDLDLEADLGVDTVKQAELFAAIRQIYDIPRADNLKLRDFPTLAHIIRFVHDRRPDLAAAPEPIPDQSHDRQGVGTISSDPVKERILALVVEKTGYPKDMLDLDLDLEADLGVDTVKQAELFAAIRQIYEIPRADNLKLRDFPTLAHIIRFVYDKRSDLAAAPPAAIEQKPVEQIPAEPPTAADSIQEQVLDIVAQKTGYPREMLDLDLDLEADLGIDTVKQAELFATVRQIYQIPRDQNLKLRDFPTLAHVIRFARERHSTGTAVSPTPEPARPQPATFDAANRIPRRVPVPDLRPPLAICKTTGVTLGAGSRVLIVPDRGGVAQALAQQLTARGVEVVPTDDVSAGEVQGVYWLPALDHEGDLREMDFAAWHEGLRVRLKSFYTTMRARYGQVAASGTFLVSATRLGGQHGYDEAGAFAPMGGAVTGFTKTYKRERMDALVKAVDFEPACEAPVVAEILIQETLMDPGAVEIGYQGGQRWTVGLEEQPATGVPALALDSNTVFLITGAAGSIVSAITADLAAASGGAFYLLDLAPEPDPANSDLARFISDRDGLKRDLFARIQARGERATPALVDKELAALERARAALDAIDAVRRAGGDAHYFAVDITDPQAVAQAIGEVRQRHGRIDVLLHAAGIERSHFLPDKDPREFDLVFNVKSDGWFNLLHAIGDMPLGATVAFSSIAGRFGNAGQTDYSAANDLLCKITSSFRTTRPATRGIVIDWTAWGGIGMATRGSIPKMMELAGIDMLPPEAGIPLIRRELTEGGLRGELVVGQRLGALLSEWDETGGLDIAAAESSAQGPMIGRIAEMSGRHGFAIETTLDPAVQPFLHDHQIDGVPVLPGVMGIEAFAEAAQSMLPGWHVAAVENVNFLAPFKFYRNEPRTLTIQTVFRPEGEAMVADCRLIGRRSLANQAEPQETTHFTASVRLAKQAPEIAAVAPPGPPSASVEAADIYRVYFHGKAYQVVERAWRDGNVIVGRFACDLPPNHQPSERTTLMAPRLIELCFQTAGLWELGTQGRMGLPQHLDRVSLDRAPDESEEALYAVVTPGPDGASFDAEVVGATGTRYLRVGGYRTIAAPLGLDSQGLEALRGALAEAVPV